ncbi:hypothetical protein TorRG33x02_242100 [Trema orientale]|uniref:Uncharacterized protein n=1 Tax=Trema orientale TaxID=63057 RepID=A0A2P5DTZ5_TREOI|nr:hypothetical protein TorRG33x02_242100 [Trema orientale]
MEIPEVKQVKLVVYKFKGSAITLWDQMETNKRLARKPTIKTWHRLQKLMREQLLPSDFEHFLFKQYQSCAQCGHIVKEFTMNVPSECMSESQ